MRVEWKKLWSKKLVIALSVLLFLGQLFQMSFFREVDAFGNEKDEKIYTSLLKEYEGELTPEKYESFQSKKEELEKAEEEKGRLIELAYSGELNAEEQAKVKEGLSEYEKKRQQEYAISYMGRQMEYAKEDMGNRAILNPLGWKELLGQTSGSVWLLIFLFLVNTMLFTSEYESEMQVITITTKRGKRKQFPQKCIAGILTSLPAILICLFMQDVLYIASYDYSGWNAKMQSVRMFEHAPYQITLLQAYLAIRLMRIIGYLLVVAAAWAVSVWLKKFFPAFFVLLTCSLVGVFVPQDFLYYIPLPFAAISAGGFFRGEEWIYLNEGTASEIAELSFRGGNKAFQYAAFTLCVVGVALAVRFAYVRYGNLSGKIRKRKHKKKAVPLAMCLLFTGCSMNPGQTGYPDTEDVIYEKRANLTDKEVIFGHQGALYGYDTEKHSGRQIPLPPEITERLEEGSWPLFAAYERKLYIMIPFEEDPGAFCVYGYDLEERKIKVLEKQQRLSGEKLFGLIPRQYSGLDARPMGYEIDTFFLYGGQFYIWESGNMWKMEKDGERKMLFEAQTLVNGYENGSQIAGIDYNLDLFVYDLEKEKKEVVSERLVKAAYAGGNMIYYNCLEEPGVFCYQDGKDVRVIEGEFEILGATDGYCYVRKGQEENIYVYEEKTGKLEASDVMGQVFFESADEGVLVIVEDGESQFFWADPKLQQLEKIKY